MNQQLQDFARTTLKAGLHRLPDEHQKVFRQMYSHRDLTLPIDAVVDAMPADRLDWAMQQVQNSLDKLGTPAPQAAAAVVPPAGADDGWREFVAAVADGSAAEHHGQLHCNYCGVNLEHTHEHLADCLMLRAKAYLDQHPAEGNSRAPNFDAARKFLELYGQPRPGYDTTVSGMVAHLAEQGYPKAYPDWAYVTGGLLQPEQALHWLAYLLAAGPVPAAPAAASAAPSGTTPAP